MKAYAKLNLFLDVVSKRLDGYHDILSVMQAIDLHDVLTIRKTDSSEAVIFRTDCTEVPAGDGNLVAQAARLMIREYGIKESFEINLEKNIPVGAGLAGGSADCAAAIKGIDSLFNLGIPIDELKSIGRSLGADVPFCLIGGTCLAQGIGDDLTLAAPHPDCYFVVAYPEVSVSTKEIFNGLSLSKRVPRSTDLAKLMHSLSSNDLTGVAHSLYNVFTDITSARFPKIKKQIELLMSRGALGASMTGTGSAVFGYFVKGHDAIKAIEAMAGDARAFLAKPVLGV